MDDRMSHIIARVLSGESNASELLALSDWLHANEVNRTLFTRMKAYWDAEVSYHHSVEPTLAVAQLEERIGQQQRRLRRRSLWLVRVPLVAAVSLLLILSTLFTYTYLHRVDPIEYYTLMTQDRRTDFTLDDGTIVTLNRNSRLRYSNQYGSEERRVSLEGEAYFQVTHDAQKPFRVEMEGATIEVLGTTFNVQADTAQHQIVATLVEGSVAFQTRQKNIVLKPEQQLTYSRLTHQYQIQPVNTDLVVAWKEGLLRYRSVPFVQLVEDLRKAYQIPISITDEVLRQPNVIVSGSFDEKLSLEEIFQVVNRSLPIRWLFRNGGYEVSRIRPS